MPSKKRFRIGTCSRASEIGFSRPASPPADSPVTGYAPGSAKDGPRELEGGVRARASRAAIVVGSNANRHLSLVRGFPLDDKDGKLTGYYPTVEVLDGLDD